MDNLPKAVLLDLDGVITDTAELHYKAWKRLADEIEVPFDEIKNERLRGVSRIESLNIILEDERDRFSATEIQQLATKKNGYYKEMLSTLGPESILPGIPGFLESLRKSGISCGLASASANAPEILDRLLLIDYFNHVADVSKIKNGKPAPDIFLAAAYGCSATPSRCIGIEDAVAGIQAIKSAEMFSVGVGAQLAQTAPHYLVKSTLELNLQDILSQYSSYNPKD